MWQCKDQENRRFLGIWQPTRFSERHIKMFIRACMIVSSFIGPRELGEGIRRLDCGGRAQFSTSQHDTKVQDWLGKAF